MNTYKLNTKYKDRLFRLIFRDKKELLELYNAVNESHYTNPDDLEITTIEDAVYKAYIEPVKHKLYFDSKLEIPFPQYIIFYNGIEKKPERQELKLSTLFVGNGKGKTPALECTALMLNVNLGQNKELMERCKTLKGYAQFIAIIRRILTENLKHREAVEQAVV